MSDTTLYKEFIHLSNLQIDLTQVSGGQDVLARQMNEQHVLLFQWVVAVYGCSFQDIYSFPDTPHTAERGGPLEGGLVLPCPHDIVGPGHLLLPLCPPAIPCHGDPPASPNPALLTKGRAVLLVVLLSVGNSTDGAVGGTFVGVLIRRLFLLPVASVLGQCPTEATS